MPELIDAEGNFTDDFKTALPDMLGEDHVGSKVMDDIPSLSMLVKRHADTKTDYGKRLENVIQKPGDDASDGDKAEFTKTLLTHLGTAEKVEDFDLTVPTLPEDMTYNKEQEADYRNWCLENNIPKHIASLYADKYNAMNIEIFNASAEATKATLKEHDEAWDAECEQLKKDWPGVELNKNLRMALDAIKTFNKNNPELLAALEKSGLYTNPENFGALKEAGLTPANIRGWQEIGEALLDGTFERGVTIQPGDSDETKALKETYNHPTSAELHK